MAAVRGDGRLVAPPPRVRYALSQAVGIVGVTEEQEISRHMASERAFEGAPPNQRLKLPAATEPGLEMGLAGGAAAVALDVARAIPDQIFNYHDSQKLDHSTR
jgi:hypothetical protein